MSYDRTGTIRTGRFQPTDRTVERTAEEMANATLDNVEVVDGVATLAGPDIPDSVVSRPDDNNSLSQTDGFGVVISSTVEWPEIGARLSANVSGVTTAYIERLSDNTILDTVDISALSAGETLIFDAEIATSTDYGVYVDADGSSYTGGFNDTTPPPISSNDGKLTIENGYRSNGDTFTNLWSFVELGDVGFD